jgi:hypothetical protein
MPRRYDDPTALDPLSPPPVRDSRWFVPAHGSGNVWTAHRRGHRADSRPGGSARGATRGVPDQEASAAERRPAGP